MSARGHYKHYKFMDKLLNLVNSLSGYKTYAVGGLMVLLGLLNGDNNMVLQGLGLLTVRHAIAKVGK